MMEKYIDLGLPSGTLWADRNYKANSIEEYGIYGSLSQIKEFQLQIPSGEQVKELFSSCEHENVCVNGISGEKFTGPNHNSIFIPIALSPTETCININILHKGWDRGYWFLSKHNLSKVHYSSTTTHYSADDTEYHAIRLVKKKK